MSIVRHARLSSLAASRLVASGRLLAVAVLAIMALGLAQPARADDAAVDYVKRVARELIAANHAGSMQAFTTTFNNHAHVQAIGTYALGSYRPNLKPTDRDGYFAGMIRFISRYAATESQKYHVSNIQVLGKAFVRRLDGDRIVLAIVV